MKPKVYIIKSSSWMPSESTSLSNIQSYLDEAIEDFVEDGEEIINIETKQVAGQEQFWIYVKSNNT